MASPGGRVGPLVNESNVAVFLGSAAPPKDLALESLTLSENAELLLPEVFDQTPVVSRIPPGGVGALAQGLLIISATSTAKASSRIAALVSFVGNGSEGRVLLVGTADAIGNAAVRDVDGQLTIVPLDPNVTVYPIRQSARPACPDVETKKTLEWTDRVGTATIETQTWSAGCIEVGFVGDEDTFRACLPEDAWPFEVNRSITFTPFAKRTDLTHTNGLGERGVTISDGKTTLELGLVNAPLSWAAPIDDGAALAVEPTKHCVTVHPSCAVTTPIAVTLVERDARRTLAVGVPFESAHDGQLVTRRIVGGRVTPIRRMACGGEASGYGLELITLRRSKSP